MLRLRHFLLLFCIALLCSIGSPAYRAEDLTTDGPASVAKGKELFSAGKYEEASAYFWRSVLLHESSNGAYTVEEAFGGFIQCYAVEGKTADGFVFIAKESIKRGQKEMAERYLEQALQIDEGHEEALDLRARFKYPGGGYTNPTQGYKPPPRENKFQPRYGTAEDDDPLAGKSPEDLYEYGSTVFARKNYEYCADAFELSCRRSDFGLGPSCANAVYCRNMILDWGYNGTVFDSDMERIITLTEQEVALYRTGNLESFKWSRATSVHPHMMLGYPIPSLLKRYSAESSAYMDEMMARVRSDGKLRELPSDLPYDPIANLEAYQEEAAQPGFRLKVGFVGSGFNSKAVLFLSQDIFRFYDRSKIEVHVFSLGPADNAKFIQVGMDQVDWRKRVQQQVDHFHDIESIKQDHVAIARFIHHQGIHILVEWDGYARQGERAQGLMALRPAPIQILHQEFLGTSGSQYIDYIVSDKVTSPPELHHLYTEKIIYMPNHFFSKGHAMQKEVHLPRHEYRPAKKPYQLGYGSPQENRCLSEGATRPSFVFCNFNKFLKNNPETMRSWIRILREVPGSMLCLLGNPNLGRNYLRRFIHEATGVPSSFVDEKDGNLYETFTPGDGDIINDQVLFLQWENNPFKHQARNQDFCNVMLDNYPYNGHTVAQDSLYAGVPIVTRSDGDDMSSRVTTSANIVLGLEELNAYGGPKQYEEIAIAIGTNATMYADVRKRLIDTALQRNPMHPYWDAARYTTNLMSGFMRAWQRFISALDPEDIYVEESEETKRGSYDDFLDAHPSDKVPLSGVKSDEL